MLFSQRHGFTAVQALQTDDMDDALRNRLWTALSLVVWNRADLSQGDYTTTMGSELGEVLYALWNSFFKQPLDKAPEYFDSFLQEVRKHFFQAQWYKVYDLLEFIAGRVNKPYADELSSHINRVFQAENAGYRIVSGCITPITSAVETGAIDAAIGAGDAFAGARIHLTSVLRLLANRERPDYRNSIKESISAVESVCQVLVGDANATLGGALKVIEKKGHLHAAFKAGLSSLYGYTSDAEGIRHALLDEPTVTFADAKYMLVTCSGFVSYLIGKVAELGVELPATASPDKRG